MPPGVDRGAHLLIYKGIVWKVYTYLSLGSLDISNVWLQPLLGIIPSNHARCFLFIV